MDHVETANPDVTVPDNFPRDQFPAALSGVQPKIAARLIDGEYVVAERKRNERTDLTLPALLDAIDVSVSKKGWEVAGIELDWIMGRVRARLL